VSKHLSAQSEREEGQDDKRSGTGQMSLTLVNGKCNGYKGESCGDRGEENELHVRRKKRKRIDDEEVNTMKETGCEFACRSAIYVDRRSTLRSTRSDADPVWFRRVCVGRPWPPFDHWNIAVHARGSE
jgi:hypothetical protein